MHLSFRGMGLALKQTLSDVQRVHMALRKIPVEDPLAGSSETTLFCIYRLWALINRVLSSEGQVKY